MAKIETNLSPAQVRIAETLFGGTYAVTIGKRSGATTSVPVPVADMPENAVLALFTYGVQRKFNDAIGGSDTTPEEKITAARDMVAAFTRGEVAKARGTSESVDPVTAEIRSMLRADVKKAWIAENNAEGWKAREESDIVADIDAVFDAQDDATQAAIRATAEEAIAAKEAARKAKSGVLAGLKVALKK